MSKHDEFCIKKRVEMMNFVLKTSRIDEFCINNEGFCIENDEFCIENEEFVY